MDEAVQQVEQSEQVEEVRSTNNQLYFGGLVLALLFFLLEETTLNLPSTVNLMLKLVPMMMLTLHLLSVFTQYTKSEKFLLLFAMLVSVLVGIKTYHLTQLYVTCALVFGTKGMSARMLLSKYFRVSALFCIVIVAMALSGIIENKELLAKANSRENIFGDVVSTRSCYGYVWPTDFATHVFFIMMTYWLLKEGRMTFKRVLLYIGITYAMLMTTDSRLGCGCIFLLVVCSFFLKVFLGNNSEDKSGFFKKVISLLLAFWIPFVGFLSYFATVKYNPADVVWFAINLLLSGRLRIGQDALDDYGIPVWGQIYKLYGGESDPNLYNYIDSSYMQLLIIYGAVYTFLIILAYVYLGYKAYRQHDMVLLFTLFVAGISGAIAQHFIQIFMNPLLLLLFAYNDISTDGSFSKLTRSDNVSTINYNRTGQ